jgi:glucose/arabinose dehydrogenase
VIVEAQNRQSPPLPPLPLTVFTDQLPVRVSAVATGLSHPWGMAWLPDGSMLVTERPGRLRLIRNGGLDPNPISGVPQVRAVVLGGMKDVALHPKFAEYSLVYLAYSKARADGLRATALARGRLGGMAVSGV